MLWFPQRVLSLTACWTLLFILPAFGRQAPIATESAPTPGKSQSPAASDKYGDPLPGGAVSRLGTARWRPGGEISTFAFHPDGRILATASKNGTHLWETTTGRLIRELRTMDWWQTSAVPCETVAFSLDGRMVAAGEWAPVCWETGTGKVLRQFLAGHGKVRGLAFSPNGKILAAAWDDRTVQLYELATGQELRPLTAKKPLRSVAFSPNGEVVAAGGTDGELRLWQAATGKELHHLVGQEDIIDHLSFSPDSRILASAGWDGTVRLWETATGKELRRLTAHEHMVTLVAFSRDGKTFFSWGADNVLRLWNPATGQEVRRLAKPYWGGTCLALSPNDGTVAAGGLEWAVTLWQTATGQPVVTPKGNQRSISAHFLPDSQTTSRRRKITPFGFGRWRPAS
jgi:WD40 repeat protein